MKNIEEQQPVNYIPYLPISNLMIEGLKGKSDKQLSELGIPEGVLFMICQGLAKQLREDVYFILFKALDLDISADISSPKQSPEK